MKKHFLLAGAALLGAALAGSTTQPASAPAKADAGESLAAGTYSRTFTDRKPAPTKPAAPATAQRQVAVRTAMPMPADFVHFIERTGPRKVKYGKRRWVVLS